MNDPSITIAALCAGFGVGYALGWTNAVKAAAQAVSGNCGPPRRMSYSQKLEWHRRRRMIRDGELFEEEESMQIKPEPRYLSWHEMTKSQRAAVVRLMNKSGRTYQ